MTLIGIAVNEMEANLWKDVLAENGIKCLLKTTNLVTSLYVSTLTLQYAVYVLKSDAEKAKEILAPFIEEQKIENEHEEPG